MNEIDELKLAIYEAYENEEITESEKDELLTSIDEKEVYTERLETNIKDKVGFGKKYDLYHVSNAKIDKTIKANSVNMGTRLSKARLSSFWTRDKELAMFWAAFKTICNSELYGQVNIDMTFNIKRRRLVIYNAEYIEFLKPPKKELSTDMINAIWYALKSNDASIRGDVDKVAKLAKKEDLVKEALKKTPCYLYTKKDVPIKDIGSGQFRIDEYTLDKDTDFDSVEQIKPEDMLKAIDFVDDYKEFKKLNKKDDAIGYKSKNVFTDLLLYGTKNKAREKSKQRRDLYYGLNTYKSEIENVDPHKAFNSSKKMMKYIRGIESMYKYMGIPMSDKEFEKLIDKAKEKYVK